MLLRVLPTFDDAPFFGPPYDCSWARLILFGYVNDNRSVHGVFAQKQVTDFEPAPYVVFQ